MLSIDIEVRDQASAKLAQLAGAEWIDDVLMAHGNIRRQTSVSSISISTSASH